VSELSLPRSDEPFDFRHQAACYGAYRRDYSPALYSAIEASAGRGEGRVAVDLGCGTGFVATELGRRGWRPVGVDFSAPMLAAARRAAPSLALARGLGEALPLHDAAASLLTCGTAFHWLAPAPALAEIARVLAPGGWAALFWRYAHPDEPYWALVAEVLSRFGPSVPAALPLVHPLTPFADSTLVPAPPAVIDCTLEFTVESFHGYVATVEWVRRMAGEHHAAFLAALREALEQRWPHGFQERNQEYLFLARK
jgi:SAM-dependent methyltransferase